MCCRVQHPRLYGAVRGRIPGGSKEISRASWFRAHRGTQGALGHTPLRDSQSAVMRGRKRWFLTPTGDAGSHIPTSTPNTNDASRKRGGCDARSALTLLPAIASSCSTDGRWCSCTQLLHRVTAPVEPPNGAVLDTDHLCNVVNDCLDGGRHAEPGVQPHREGQPPHLSHSRKTGQTSMAELSPNCQSCRNVGRVLQKYSRS